MYVGLDVMKYGTEHKEIRPELKDDLQKCMEELVDYYNYLYYEEKLELEEGQLSFREFLKSVFDTHFSGEA